MQQTIKTSNLWAAAWAIYRNVPVVRYHVISGGYIAAVELDNANGQAYAALNEFYLNPTAPIQDVIAVRTAMIRTAKRSA